MPAGDAQRVCFPEMAERLRSAWHEGISLQTLIELRDELDAMLARIRAERSTRTPVFTHPRSGEAGVARGRAGEKGAPQRDPPATPQAPVRRFVEF